MSEKITAQHLERRAVVSVRQSTPQQVSCYQESRRLQYAMRDRLRGFGWSEVELIDDDLARQVERRNVRASNGWPRGSASASWERWRRATCRALRGTTGNGRDWSRSALSWTRC